MDAATQRRNLIAFYFGTPVATGDVTSDRVIDGVTRRAYVDLQRTIHGFGSHKKKKHLKEHTHTTIRQFVAELASCKSQTDFDQRHNEWCVGIRDYFGQFPHHIRSNPIFHYGHAQKWLNMTLKYLAVLDHPDVQQVYSYLHVPVDKYVYDEAARAGVPRPKGRIPWSKLTEKQYLDYQHSIREMVAASQYPCPLDWEAEVWVTRAASNTTT